MLFHLDHSAGLFKGMIANTLDAERKPMLGIVPQVPSERQNRYIKYWFRPWLAGTYSIHAQGDSTIPEYKCTKNCGNVNTNEITFVSIKSVNHDTAFKNIVINDSLPFLHKQNGVYEFSRTGSNQFFWLDGKGFGDEGKKDQANNPHNYSFTMELHTKFEKQNGLLFHFTGDDDVWAFVNGRLAMDLGGLHAALTDSIVIDNIAGLENGKEYAFDFFYAERHTFDSNIRITTNLISTTLPKRRFR